MIILLFIQIVAYQLLYFKGFSSIHVAVQYILPTAICKLKGLFELYQHNPFLGLLSLDFLYLFNNIIIVVIYLALFVLLYQERPVTVLLALILGLIGIACYYPSNPAFEMLTLSNKYFQAQPEQLHIYLSAGEALMAGYTGSTFDVYYVLSTICLLLFAYALIKTPKKADAMRLQPHGIYNYLKLWWR